MDKSKAPRCPFCGEEMAIKFIRGIGYWYVCRGCTSAAALMDTPEGAKVAAMRRPSQMTLKEIVELQKSYNRLFNSNRMTKRAICDLVRPFRDKYGLTDLMALRVVRNELSLEEIEKLISSSRPTDEEIATAKWEE